MLKKQTVTLEVVYSDLGVDLPPSKWAWSRLVTLTGSDESIRCVAETPPEAYFDPDDEYHLVVSWSKANGWVVTDLAPNPDGDIYNAATETWRTVRGESELGRFNWMCEQITHFPSLPSST